MKALLISLKLKVIFLLNSRRILPYLKLFS